jgi:hypothetical protein
MTDLIPGADLHQHAGRQIHIDRGWFRLLWADPEDNGLLLRVRTQERGREYLVRASSYEVRGERQPAPEPDTGERWDNEPPAPPPSGPVTDAEPPPSIRWRVQWYSRNGIDAPDRAEGRHDFDTEHEARAYYLSDETQSRVGQWWRVELQQRPDHPWTRVDGTDYTDEEQP